MRSMLVAFVLALTTIASAPADAQEQQAPGYRIDTPSQDDGGGRSGFWTSRAPAKNGAYRWRLLGIGVGLLGITGYVMIRLVRKANAERDKLPR